MFGRRRRLWCRIKGVGYGRSVIVDIGYGFNGRVVVFAKFTKSGISMLNLVADPWFEVVPRAGTRYILCPPGLLLLVQERYNSEVIL